MSFDYALLVKSLEEESTLFWPHQDRDAFKCCLYLYDCIDTLAKKDKPVLQFASLTILVQINS